MKILGSVIAAAALALSTLVAIPSTASAAYPGTVATACSYAAPGAVKRKRSYNVAYRAQSAGNARPSGIAIFRIWKIGKHGDRHLVRVLSNGFTGPDTRSRSLGTFKQKGLYVSQFAFRPSGGSVYQPCATGFRSFQVTR